MDSNARSAAVIIDKQRTRLLNVFEYLENNRYILWSVLIITGLIYIFISDGFYYIDEGAHYMANREFFFNPGLANNIWGRMGRVILYAPFAYFGPYAVKIAAFFVFLGIIYFSIRSAEFVGFRFPSLLILLIGFQPVCFDISFSVLAEIPAMFLFTLGFYLYLTKKPAAAMLAMSLLFLFRFELFVFTGLFFLLLIKEKQYRALLLAPLGPLIWWLFAWITSGNPADLLQGFSAYSSIPKFRTGTDWYHYFALTPFIFGIAATVFFIFGLRPLRSGKNKMFAGITLTVIGTAYILFSLLSSRYLNISGSVGDNRYLAQIAPFFGFAALAGFENLLTRLQEQKNTNPSGKLYYTILLLCAFMVFQVLLQVKPHTFSHKARAIFALTKKAQELNHGAFIYSNHWAARFQLGYPYENASLLKTYDSWETIRGAESGFIIWDLESSGGVPFSTGNVDPSSLLHDSTIAVIDSIKYAEETFYLFKIIEHEKQNPSLYENQIQNGDQIQNENQVR